MNLKKSALVLRTLLSGGFATKQWPHLTLFEMREPTPNQTHSGHVGLAAGPIWGSRPNWDVHNGVLSASARTPLPASIPSQLSVPGPHEPSMWDVQLGGPPLNISQLRSLLPPNPGHPMFHLAASAVCSLVSVFCFSPSNPFSTQSQRALAKAEVRG